MQVSRCEALLMSAVEMKSAVSPALRGMCDFEFVLHGALARRMCCLANHAVDPQQFQI
jgi:hypothetical protein